MPANTDDNTIATVWLESNVKRITHMPYMYNPTPLNLLGTITGCVIGLQGRTCTLGLVLAEGPPGVARLANVSSIRGATVAGLGLAVRTHAHVR